MGYEEDYTPVEAKVEIQQVAKAVYGVPKCNLLFEDYKISILSPVIRLDILYYPTRYEEEGGKEVGDEENIVFMSCLVLILSSE